MSVSIKNLFKKVTSVGPDSLEELVEVTEDSLNGFRFNLGDEVRDCVTGFTGVVVHRSQWLNACNTYGVKPRQLQNNMPVDTVAFDEPQLSLKEPEVVKSSRKTGGPERHVVRP